MFNNPFKLLHKVSKLIGITILFVLPIVATAQFERKVSLYVNTGIAVFPGSEKINQQNGQATNIFGAYKPAPMLGGAILYAIDGHFSAGGSIRAMRSVKPYSSILVNSVGGIVKYNIIPSDKKISPYVFFEGNLSFVSIAQKSHNSSFTPSNQGNSDTIPVSTINTTYTTFNVLFAPTFGIYSGGGVDIQVSEAFNLFVQLGYNECFARNTRLIRDNFSSNSSNLSYWNAAIGVRLNLFKKKTFY